MKKQLPLWANILVLLGVAVIAAYLLSRNPEQTEYEPSSLREYLELQTEIDGSSPGSSEDGLVLEEEVPQHVTIEDGIVDVAREGLIFRIPDGYKVAAIRGTDTGAVSMLIQMQKGTKKLTVFINWPTENYSPEWEEVGITVRGQQETYAVYDESTEGNPGVYMAGWTDYKYDDKYPNRYLTVMLRNYEPSDRRIIEALINSFEYRSIQL
jgi:hypothetical protein